MIRLEKLRLPIIHIKSERVLWIDYKQQIRKHFF